MCRRKRRRMRRKSRWRRRPIRPENHFDSNQPHLSRLTKITSLQVQEYLTYRSIQSLLKMTVTINLFNIISSRHAKTHCKLMG